MLQLLLNQKLIFGLMGGLGLFLFGMKIMSEGLQKIAGNRMRKILASLTNNRIVGALVGIAVTAMVQSSSATTVMVVGFVNAGLMSLVQSIGVILGANIGTTVTAQLIAFKITKYALPAIGIGAALKLFMQARSCLVSVYSSLA
jgi:phosphate:Na+ symporter